MAKHFLYGFFYWAKTGRRSFGYLFSKRDYHHALDRYKQKQVIKTEQDELKDELNKTEQDELKDELKDNI